MKIGILTFHRVYNYGAVIQAYCTQQIINDLGIRNEIIDYSIPQQKDFTDLYSKKNGLKRYVKTLLLVPFHKKRMLRKNKFDLFINSLNLSKKSYIKAEDLYETNEDYDCFLVGSDQVWNVTKKAESSDAYFLDFVDEGKKKISYASSIGVATYDDLIDKKVYLKRFNAISCRESGGSKILGDLTGNVVQNVLDPTLLVDKKHLLSKMKKIELNSYILYYSLDGFDKRTRNLDILRQISETFGLSIKFITPEWPCHRWGEDIIDAGPVEFLSLIRNASLVCTNSFHGTALSIKLETPFYVLEEKNIEDERKRSILKQLNLENRIISSVEEAKGITNYNMCFEEVNIKLEKLRKLSGAYLKSIIEDGEKQ